MTPFIRLKPSNCRIGDWRFTFHDVPYMFLHNGFAGPRGRG